MNVKFEVSNLLGEIKDGLAALSKIELFLVTYERETINRGRTGLEQALALSQALGNYYTCLETIFFRISRFFENSLPPDRRHQELIEKMTMEIPDIRPAVISHQSFQALMELLRFRHFSRYYYEFDYDWDKLRFLLLKFNAVREEIKREISTFVSLLEKLRDEAAAVQPSRPE